jgi:oxygen-independent coproporphyrinogen-3 oxidase
VIADRYTMEARSAYVHIPFCRHRCGYCNFTLVAGRDRWIGRFLRSLATELALLKTPRPIDTLFLGGGTPTHLSTAQLDELLNLLDHWLPRREHAEFSVEANPTDLMDEQKHAVLRHHGVTRLSLGVQSFQPRKLRLLERDHQASEVKKVVDLLRPWIASLSMDLIFGTPEESLEEWRSDLDQALELSVDHLSTYGLTFEKGTSFWTRRSRGDLAELDEDSAADCYEFTIDRLTEHQFQHYEVSNFAQPGHRCRHNEVYWSGQPFFGFGPGAASYTGIQRDVNHRSTFQYFKLIESLGHGVGESERLTNLDRAKERLVIGLRRLDGWNLLQFEKECGVSVDDLVGARIDRLVQMGYLIRTNKTLKLSRSGLLISDSLWSELLES